MIVKMARWENEDKQKYYKSIHNPICNEYKLKLKEWKQTEGEKWISEYSERIKKHPEIWNKKKPVLDKGLDVLFPDN